MPWSKTEKQVIVAAVEKSKGNISLAGLLLGLGRTAMHRHLKSIWPDYRQSFPRKWPKERPGIKLSNHKLPARRTTRKGF